MNAAPTRHQFAKLLKVAAQQGIPLTQIPAMTSAEFKTAATPHPDGFGGARDASILATYDREGDFVFVQATTFTRHLLQRAGVKRVKIHAFYKVPVKHCPRVNGLQLAGNAAQA